MFMNQVKKNHSWKLIGAMRMVCCKKRVIKKNTIIHLKELKEIQKYLNLTI